MVEGAFVDELFAVHLPGEDVAGREIGAEFQGAKAHLLAGSAGERASQMGAGLAVDLFPTQAEVLQERGVGVNDAPLFVQHQGEDIPEAVQETAKESRRGPPPDFLFLGNHQLISMP